MKITRKELYDLVWSEPLTTICKRFGLTDNGLRKHCKSMDIPTPPPGYWAKVKYGKKAEKTPLPGNYKGNKQSTELTEVDPSKQAEVDLTTPINPIKELEIEITSGDTSSFVVPELLYAKDALIIDTKEKFRQEAENVHLKKNPFKTKIGPTLDIQVSMQMLERGLRIFETIIKALKYRGHKVSIEGNKTYVIIEDEKIKVDLRERRKQVPAASGSFYRFDTAYAGELQFNVFNEYERVISTFKDTPRSRIEDKIISIVANLEIRSKTIKEDRIEAERIRIIREKEERERQQFKEKRKQEYHEFLSLFSMAERLHKTFILRQYISTYEDFVKNSNEMNEEIAAKIKWAREKADWLDPFINKEDLYMDHYNKDEIIQPECPKQNMWDNPGYRSSTGDTFWSRKYKFWR